MRGFKQRIPTNSIGNRALIKNLSSIVKQILVSLYYLPFPLLMDLMGFRAGGQLIVSNTPFSETVISDYHY